MRTKARLAIYLVVGLALIAIFMATPGAWAEPLQHRLGQTVPTRTPTGAAAPPTDAPPTAAPATPRPGATAAPPPTDAPPPADATAAPAGAPTEAAPPVPPAPPVAASALSLAMTASRDNIWPGVQVVFTATLTNTSAASVRQVRLEDLLPEGLEPAAIQGQEATWAGRTLRLERAVLPPNGRLTVVFAARVADKTPATSVIINRATATAGGAAQPTERATASVRLILPPLELPPVGGSGCAAFAR